MHAWEIRSDDDGQLIVVTDSRGQEVMGISAEELVGDLGPRNVLSMLKQRLAEGLDDPMEYRLAGDIFAMTEKPSPRAKRRLRPNRELSRGQARSDWASA